MICKKCGHENRDAWIFCGKCGFPLSPHQESNVPSTNIMKQNANNDTTILPKSNQPFYSSPAQPQPVLSFNPNTIYNQELKKKAPVKSKRLIFIIVTIFFIVAGVSVPSIFAVSALNTKKYDKLIDTGNKYLDELKYEEAVETFLDAIEIKPRSENAYIGAVKAYIALDEKDKAKDIITKGVQKVIKPGEEFRFWCNYLGVAYEGSETEFETTSKDVQKQFTSDNIEELSRYLYGKGYDQIDWNNMNQETALEIFWGASSYGGMQNILVEGSAEYIELTALVNENINLIEAYRLADVNKNVISIFGNNARLLSKNDFAVFDGSNSYANGQEGPVFVAYNNKFDCIVIPFYGYGWEDLDLDYIVDSKTQGDTILVRRCFFTISSDDTYRVTYEPPSNWGTGGFSVEQNVAKNYYNAAKSAGIYVNEKIMEYTLAYNADGTIYLKSVSEANVTNTENYAVQTTESFFGRSISTVYMVKTKAGGPINIRSGPGLSYEPITTIPNGTVATGLNLSKDEQWVYVTVNGTAGWVSLEYLTVYS